MRNDRRNVRIAVFAMLAIVIFALLGFGIWRMSLPQPVQHVATTLEQPAAPEEKPSVPQMQQSEPHECSDETPFIIRPMQPEHSVWMVTKHVWGVDEQGANVLYKEIKKADGTPFEEKDYTQLVSGTKLMIPCYSETQRENLLAASKHATKVRPIVAHANQHVNKAVAGIVKPTTQSAVVAVVHAQTAHLVTHAHTPVLPREQQEIPIILVVVPNDAPRVIPKSTLARATFIAPRTRKSFEPPLIPEESMPTLVSQGVSGSQAIATSLNFTPETPKFFEREAAPQAPTSSPEGDSLPTPAPKTPEPSQPDYKTTPSRIGVYEVILTPEQAAGVPGISTGRFPALSLFHRKKDLDEWQNYKDSIALVRKSADGRYWLNVLFKTPPSKDSAIAIDFGQPENFRLDGEDVLRLGTLLNNPIPKAPPSFALTKKHYAILHEAFYKNPSKFTTAFRIIMPTAVPIAVGFMTGGPFGAGFAALPLGRNLIASKLMRMGQPETVKPQVLLILRTHTQQIQTLSDGFDDLRRKLDALQADLAAKQQQ